jgi:hypothetical protein
MCSKPVSEMDGVQWQSLGDEADNLEFELLTDAGLYRWKKLHTVVAANASR